MSINTTVAVILTVSLAATLPGAVVPPGAAVCARAASGAAPISIAEIANAIVDVPTFIVAYLQLFKWDPRRRGGISLCGPALMRGRTLTCSQRLARAIGLSSHGTA